MCPLRWVPSPREGTQCTIWACFFFFLKPHDSVKSEAKSSGHRALVGMDCSCTRRRRSDLLLLGGRGTAPTAQRRVIALPSVPFLLVGSAQMIVVKLTTVKVLNSCPLFRICRPHRPCVACTRLFNSEVSPRRRSRPLSIVVANKPFDRIFFFFFRHGWKGCSASPPQLHSFLHSLPPL